MTISSSTIHRRTASPSVRRQIGYSAWGFLTAGVLDTPDGARAYRRAVIDALQDAGNEIVLLQADRDRWEADVDLDDRYRFAAGLPELDAVVFEWRWPLPGRNTIDCGTPGHTCDLHRQQELIEHYTTGLATPTVIWDMDRRLPADDPLRARANVRVGEYALRPTPGAITLACPVPDTLLDHADPYRLAAAQRPIPLVYVGNQYGRDDAFDRFFAPAAAQVTHRVAGKWTDTGPWPHVNFTGRCRFNEVADIHRGALATVLLLPERYRTVGHQTSRLFEAVTQGCLPLTPADTVAADRFTPPELHVRDGGEVVEKLHWLQSIAGTPAHQDLIRACLRLLEPYRLSTQIAVLLDTLHALGAPVRRSR
ncbi:hypothetical protein [Paractinoplanes brasiliensis]|uniref:Glycosyl transferase family 1 n=1 Tax=Paractinoplanes brasiliensis TaxID=52695 RepID=A0A4R6K1X7_9ACTN|nr:hypothetical protein [Actinoplanes brasiliensis]TDO42312.1 hypothetical protein C8E87_6080 [Actinoplanes brasiliensis]GID29541.1 hypothetical protein Abr02nite_45240 [Actinoplanes brasiliensis]